MFGQRCAPSQLKPVRSNLPGASVHPTLAGEGCAVRLPAPDPAAQDLSRRTVQSRIAVSGRMGPKPEELWRHHIHMHLLRLMCAVLTVSAVLALSLATTPLTRPAFADTDLVTNGNFSSNLSGWSSGASAVSASGTCAYNQTASPGTEAQTSQPGFNTSDPAQAVGSVSQSQLGNRSCDLYQDIAIPAGATTATLSVDVGSKVYGAQSTTDSAVWVGLYSTSSVPHFTASSVGGPAIIASPQAAPGTLAARSMTLNLSSVAGTTVRLAIINGMQSPSSGTAPPIVGGGIVGVSNVRLVLVPPAPSISGVSPTSGTTAGGTSVTITGTDFTGASSVKFGSTDAASFSVVNNSTITAVSPAGAAGTVDIRVTTTGGTSSIAAADRFSFVDPTNTPTPTATSTPTSTATPAPTSTSTPEPPSNSGGGGSSRKPAPTAVIEQPSGAPGGGTPGAPSGTPVVVSGPPSPVAQNVGITFEAPNSASTLGTGQVIVDPELARGLPNGVRLRVVADPSPTLTTPAEQGSLGGGNVRPIAQPVDIQLQALEVLSNQRLPLPDSVSGQVFRVVLPVPSAPIKPGEFVTWLVEVREEGHFLGYMRMPAAFDPATNTVTFELTGTQLSGTRFLPVVIQPAAVVNFDARARIWSSPFRNAVDFGEAAPQWTQFQVLGSQVGSRILVHNPVTDNDGWIDANGVGPVNPAP